jgi:hypothetical protein
MIKNRKKSTSWWQIEEMSKGETVDDLLWRQWNTLSQQDARNRHLLRECLHLRSVHNQNISGKRQENREQHVNKCCWMLCPLAHMLHVRWAGLSQTADKFYNLKADSNKDAKIKGRVAKSVHF